MKEIISGIALCITVIAIFLFLVVMVIYNLYQFADYNNRIQKSLNRLFESKFMDKCRDCVSWGLPNI